MPAHAAYGLPSFRTLYHVLESAPEGGLPAVHPLKDADTLQAFRNAPHLQTFLDAIRTEAQQASISPIPELTFTLFQQYEITGERVAYEQIYFLRRRRLTALALAILIDNRDEYAQPFHDLLWAICNEYTWALPAHLPVGIEAVKAYRIPPEQVIDLFAAETAHTLAEIIYLFENRLPDGLIYRIRNEIEQRIFQPLFHHPHTFKWERDNHNWAAVCGGSIGMTALLLEPDRERLTGMLSRLMNAMESFLSGFDTDGGCPEGIGYWVYGFGYFVYFADALARFTYGQVNLLASEHVRNIATFPQRISLGQGRYVNYSDANETSSIPAGLASYLAENLQISLPDIQEPDFYDDMITRWGHITRNLIWTNPAILHQPVKDGTFYLDKLAWVVDRRTVGQLPVAFSAKGGHNDEPHNHNDLGHFILSAGHENLLIDLGAGVYTRQYFGTGRYDVIQTASNGHSVPIINGNTQQAGQDHQAIVLAYHTHSTGITYNLDLTQAYDVPSLRSLIRQFDWSVDAHQARLALTDISEFAEPPTSFEECFISTIQPIIQDNKIAWIGNQAELTLQFDGHRFNATIDVISTQDHHLQEMTVYRLRLVARENVLSREDCFVFEVHPHGKG